MDSKPVNSSVAIDNFTLIIGAQKCGTTSLFSYLSQHPQICPSRKKEPNFFGNDANWERGLSWYQRLWSWDAQQHQTALEASPQYTICSSKAAERIATVDARFKFIYILRNPLERIESALYHGYYQDWGKKRRDRQEPIEHLLPRFIDVSKYAKHIREYFRRFPANSILLLQLEDLKQNPHAILARVYQFLEIDDSHRGRRLQQIHNQRNSYRQDTLWKKLMGFKFLKPGARLIPEQYKTVLRQYLSRPPKNSNDLPPPLTSQQKESICSELQDDLRELNLEYGVDISRWNFEM